MGNHRPQMFQRTDSRPLAERKASITLRVAELRAALNAAERAEAELDVEIEHAEYARERAVRTADYAAG